MNVLSPRLRSEQTRGMARPTLSDIIEGRMIADDSEILPAEDEPIRAIDVLEPYAAVFRVSVDESGAPLKTLADAVDAHSAESGVGRGPDRGVGVEARIGRYGAAISERLSPARISASYAPGSASTIDSTASKGARSAPSRWCRSARNPGEL